MKRAVLIPWLLMPGAAFARDLQSVLAPHGPQAAQIADLAWLLFAMATVVLLVVIVATWFAIRGGGRARAVLASERTVVLLGIAWPAVTLTLLLGYGLWLTRQHSGSASASEAIPIEVVGEQWWWRVHYRAPDGSTIASANEIRIPVGEPILFTLKAADVIHSFWVPSLGSKIDMIPGRTTQLRLQAERPGVYRGQCAEYCGGPHALMALEVVALPPEEFAQWMKTEAGPAATPNAARASQGAALFQAAGCGACHTVRGTPAAGTIGPDLTHLGSRRALAANVVPLSEDNIRRFITHGQTIKPGNLMPEYRIFAPDEVTALGSYLIGLK